MKEFAIRLKELREERDLTMEMLVGDLNIQFDIPFHKSNISRWESDATDPSLKHAKCIAEYFNVSLDYMIGLTDSKAPARLLAYAKGAELLKKGSD